MQTLLVLHAYACKHTHLVCEGCGVSSIQCMLMCMRDELYVVSLYSRWCKNIVHFFLPCLVALGFLHLFLLFVVFLGGGGGGGGGPPAQHEMMF